MSAWSKVEIALYTGVALTAAAGTILAVLLDNVPLGAAAGLAAGVGATLLMWPWKKRTNNR
jgi:hypothetical protein